MNHCLIYFVLLFGGNGVLQQQTCPLPYGVYSLQRDSSDLDKFKAFARLYFEAVAKRDTLFLKSHTIFPVRNSDFGLLTKSRKSLPNISSVYYFNHLDTFFPSKNVAAALKKGEFGKEPHQDKTYYLSWEAPLKDNPDLVETNSWFFEKRGDSFLFLRYKYDAN
jgi:hypothetical protein